ncbi:uncharacterized protein Mst89B isoform X2 [Eurosta solidaginis]|uniref:uncharacterized protein Mst89B isoform X2 n=1 Tax=Eurosta solidaginis TaxID=178769 RepID=UPI0035305D35
MNSDPTIRKVVQVAEQTQMPVHVFGNECFIITQQDMRRIEDSRIFSYSKVNSKGELVPMETAESNVPFINTRPQIHQFNAGLNKLNMCILPEIITRTYNATLLQEQQQQQQRQQQQQLQQAVQMAIPDLLQHTQPQMIPTVDFPAQATLQQQLDWARACGTTPAAMYPLHHTSATSTTEIPAWMSQSNATNRRQCCTRGCNTMDIDTNLSPSLNYTQMATSPSNICLDARQQAKQRKMAQFGN